MGEKMIASQSSVDSNGFSFFRETLPPLGSAPDALHQGDNDHAGDTSQGNLASIQSRASALLGNSGGRRRLGSGGSSAGEAGDGRAGRAGGAVSRGGDRGGAVGGSGRGLASPGRGDSVDLRQSVGLGQSGRLGLGGGSLVARERKRGEDGQDQLREVHCDCVGVEISTVSVLVVYVSAFKAGSGMSRVVLSVCSWW